MEQGMMAHRLV